MHVTHVTHVTHVLCFILEAHRTMLAQKRLLSSAGCGWKRQDQHLFAPVKEAARRYEVPEWALSAACEQGKEMGMEFGAAPPTIMLETVA